MAYGRNNWSGGGGGYRGGSRGGRAGKGKSNVTSTRITGLFKSAKPGLYIGGAEGEHLDALIAKIKEAKSAGKGITFFLWKTTFDEGPPFSLNVDVAMEKSGGNRSGASGRRRSRIVDEDEEEDDHEFADEAGTEEVDEDDLFGKPQKN